jgi:hypothetical protein
MASGLGGSNSEGPGFFKISVIVGIVGAGIMSFIGAVFICQFAPPGPLPIHPFWYYIISPLFSLSGTIMFGFCLAQYAYFNMQGKPFTAIWANMFWFIIFFLVWMGVQPQLDGVSGAVSSDYISKRYSDDANAVIQRVFYGKMSELSFREKMGRWFSLRQYSSDFSEKGITVPDFGGYRGEINPNISKWEWEEKPGPWNDDVEVWGINDKNSNCYISPWFLHPLSFIMWPALFSWPAFAVGIWLSNRK